MTALTFRTPAVLGGAAFNHLLDAFFNDPQPLIKRSTDGYPVTDIYKDEDGNQFIEMALAGFSKSDIKINAQHNEITISCEKSQEDKIFGHQRKIARRGFEKKFIDYYNQLDFSQTKASFKNGLLKIEIPSTIDTKSFEIKIN